MSTSLEAAEAVERKLDKEIEEQQQLANKLKLELLKEWTSRPDIPSLRHVPQSVVSTASESDVSLKLPLASWRVEESRQRVTHVNSNFSIKSQVSLGLSPTVPATPMDVRVDVQFSCLSAPGPSAGVTSLSEVSLNLSSDEDSYLYIVQTELLSLEEYALQNNDIDLYLRALADYLERSAARWLMIHDQPETVSLDDQGGVAIQLVAEDTAANMATFHWQLQFSERDQGFIESYRVDLTERGQQLGNECNLPDGLLEEGFCSFWSAKEALENLVKLTKMDARSPKKKKRRH